MDLQALHQRLLSLVIVVQHLGETQVAQVLQFLDFEVKESRWNVAAIGQLLHQVSTKQLEYLLYDCGDLQCEDPEGVKFIAQLSATQRSSFSYLYHIYLLQDLLHARFSELQLMVVTESLPPNAAPEQQFQLLQLMQELLVRLMPEQLHGLAQDPQNLVSNLTSIVGEMDARFGMVCESLCVLLRADMTDLMAIRQSLPELLPLQLVQLLRIAKIDPFDVLQLRQWLSPDAKQSERGLQALLDDPMEEELTLQLRIVEQPPEKTVYKRNLKPNPRVMLVGEAPSLPSNERLVVAPVLCRCDNHQVLQGGLTGDGAVDVTGGSMAVFKRLKLCCTTRQNDGSLLSIRFELRKLFADGESELLSFVHSNPMVVVSHSSQMHEPTTPLPNVIEACPASGPVTGGTRVAVIGRNFLPSEKTRVRFAEQVADGKVHGEGTIVCVAPQGRAAETVEVRVTNDGKAWSDDYAEYEYFDPHPGFGGSMVYATTGATHEQEFNDFGVEYFGALDGYGGSALSPDGATRVDGFGNSVLHAAAATGDIQALERVLSECRARPDMQNFGGDTPLHAAAVHGQVEAAQLLLDRGASINSTNRFAATPLHMAIANHAKKPMLDLMIARGGGLNARDEEGDTPLHWAVRAENAAAVNSLVEQGSDAAAQNEDGENPLHMAVSTRAHLSIIEKLLAAGSPIDQPDATGTTAIGMAAEEKAKDVITRLIQAQIESSSSVARAQSTSMDVEGSALSAAARPLVVSSPSSVADAASDLQSFLSGCSGPALAKDKFAGGFAGARGPLDFSPLATFQRPTLTQSLQAHNPALVGGM